MKPELKRILAAMLIPLFFIFILYSIKIVETGMEWDFTNLGIYPLEKKGVFGIFAHPLIHSGFKHLFANTLPLFFLTWCLFYFYRDLGAVIFFFAWLVGGLFTFLVGKPGWHIGASGLIYSEAFFLFFSGILRKHIPLIAVSLLVTFLYGGLIWNMFPQFATQNISWEGHLGGAIAGIIAAILFRNYGPQRPEPFSEEEEDEEGEKTAVEEEKDASRPLITDIEQNTMEAEDENKQENPIGKADKFTSSQL